MQPTAIGSNPRPVLLAGAAAGTPSAAAAAPPVPGYARVRDILDHAITAWTEYQERQPHHREIHGPDFRWDTYENLMRATVNLGSPELTFRLIDPEMVGNGRAEETWLIRYLRQDGDMFVRMPSGGPYLPDGEIDAIAQWINAGCPEHAPGQQGSLRTPELTRSLAFAQRYGRPANGAALQLAAPRV